MEFSEHFGIILNMPDKSAVFLWQITEFYSFAVAVHVTCQCDTQCFFFGAAKIQCLQQDSGEWTTRSSQPYIHV